MLMNLLYRYYVVILACLTADGILNASNLNENCIIPCSMFRCAASLYFFYNKIFKPKRQEKGSNLYGRSLSLYVNIRLSDAFLFRGFFIEE